MNKVLFYILYIFCIVNSVNAQITYNWNSFPAGGTSYSNTQGGGCTMNATINGVNFNAGAPKFDNAVGTNGTGLFLDHNWNNTSSSTDVVSNFAPALNNPSFTLYDINHNANTSDFCSNAWTDSVFISAVGATGVSFTQVNPLQQTVQVVAATVKIVGKPACNQASQGSVTISFTGPVTQITIKYLSGKRVTRCSTFTPCGASTTPPCASLVPCTDPARQFITIGNITGASCCSITNPPGSITGNTGPFCNPTTTTLTAGGTAINSQWHTGSCSGPIVGTGTSIVVTPSVTTTYYVNNLDCNNNPTSCSAITVTLNSKPSTPTITNTGLSICIGNSTTLTSSSSSGNNWSNGSTAQSINVSTAGTYTLTVSNAAGCVSNPASVVVNTVALPAIPSITASGSTSFCPGQSVVLSSSSTNGNVWSNGATSQNITVSNAGNYSVTVTNAGGCSATSSVIVVTLLSNPPAPIINNTGLSICSGQSTTLTSSSATGNNWSNGVTTQSIIANTTGTYSLHIQGANGCLSPTTSVNVSVNAVQPTPTITASGSTIFCAGGSVILSSSTASGNIWSTGANTQTILVTSSGNYSVSSGSGICGSNSSVISVTVNPLPTAPIITSSSVGLCSGQSYTLTSNVANGNLWSNGSTASSITVVNSGTYSLTYTDANLCASPSSSISVTTNTISVNVIVPSNVITCSGSIVSIPSFSSSISGTVFNWQNSNSSIGLGSSGTGNIPSFQAVNSSTNSVGSVISVTPTLNGCSGIANVFTITVDPSIIVNAGLNDTICFGANSQLNVLPNGSGYSYLWNNSSTLNNSAISNPVSNTTLTTVYTVTVTNLSGCSGQDQVTVFVNNPLTVSVSSSSITCNGYNNGSAIAIATGGTLPYQYTWNTGITTSTINTLSAGNYSVSVKDSWGCLTTNTVSLIQPNALIASVTSFSSTTCDNNCNGKAFAQAIGGVGVYTYSWNSTPVQTTINASNLCEGNYTLTVTDINNCIANTTVYISEPNPVNLPTIASSTICSGSSTTLSASASGGNGGPYSYTWSPNIAVSGVNTQTIIASPSTSIVYTVVATDALGCLSQTQTVSVTVTLPINLTVSSNTSVCYGQSVSLYSNATNPIGNSNTYNWLPPVGLNNPNSQNPIATPSVTTIYSVTVNDGCSTPVVKQVTVTVLPLPIVSFTANAINGCAPLCVDFTNLSINTNSTITSYSWSFGTEQSSDVNPKICFNNSGIFSVSLSGTSINGCVSTFSIANFVEVYPNPVANFYAPTSVSSYESEVQFSDNSVGATSWYWAFNGDDLSAINTSTLQNPTHYFTEQGLHCVFLKVKNNYGCTDVIEKCLTIEKEFTIYIPNAFSPNENNINDSFYAVGINILEFEMFIFDRWGEQIFYSDDINKHWDGKAKGGAEVAQQDVYVWKVNVKDIFGKTHNLIGHVTLLK